MAGMESQDVVGDDVFGDPVDLHDDAAVSTSVTQTIQRVHPDLRDAGVYLLNEQVMRWRAGWGPFSQVIDPTDAAAVRDLPIAKGVYIFVTPGRFHSYPGGASTVMYIGKAGGREGLRGRLKQHVHCIEHVRRGDADRFYPVYEWATTYKPLVTFVPAGAGAEDPETVEYALLKTFADAYRVIPVANSQAAW